MKIVNMNDELIKYKKFKENFEFKQKSIDVLDGTAFETIETPFTRSDLEHVIFMCVKLSLRACHMCVNNLNSQ